MYCKSETGKSISASTYTTQGCTVAEAALFLLRAETSKKRVFSKFSLTS